MKKAIFLFVIALLTACEEECKTCYFIEDANGTIISETEKGEYCGDDIDNQENVVYDCIQTDCYVECR